jgi:hypothetical protein
MPVVSIIDCNWCCFGVIKRGERRSASCSCPTPPHASTNKKPGPPAKRRTKNEARPHPATPTPTHPRAGRRLKAVVVADGGHRPHHHFLIFYCDLRLRFAGCVAALWQPHAALRTGTGTGPIQPVIKHTTRSRQSPGAGPGGVRVRVRVPAAALSNFNLRLWGCHLGCTST